MSDLIPYYPYTIGLSCHDNVKRKATIYLSSESHVDYEERDRLNTYLKYILRIYNRCKRKKIEMNIDDVVEEVCFRDWNKEQVTELAKRVKECGKKATIDGIHLAMHERYRKELVNLMLENGLNPCRYGDYERFVKRMNDEYLIKNGYKEYKSTPHLDSDSIVAKFQKRFDDDFGKKYFIDIKKWSYDYVPERHRDELWKPFGYSYYLYVTMFENEKPIFFEFGTSWTLEEVENFAKEFFEKMKPNYYESWNEERGVRP